MDDLAVARGDPAADAGTALGDDDGVATINQKLNQSGVLIYSFNEEVKDLESLFMGVTQGIVT